MSQKDQASQLIAERYGYYPGELYLYRWPDVGGYINAWASVDGYAVLFQGGDVLTVTDCFKMDVRHEDKGNVITHSMARRKLQETYPNLDVRDLGYQSWWNPQTKRYSYVWHAGKYAVICSGSGIEEITDKYTGANIKFSMPNFCKSKAGVRPKKVQNTENGVDNEP